MYKDGNRLSLWKADTEKCTWPLPSARILKYCVGSSASSLSLKAIAFRDQKHCVTDGPLLSL